MSLYVKQELEMNDLYKVLWGGAKDRWDNATDEQQYSVWSLINDVFFDSVPDLTKLNDFIWFECDDIFNACTD